MKEELCGAALAYLGDAVIELWVRELLVSFGITSSAVLSSESRLFVTAKAQSEAYERIKDILSEEEDAVFRRGRNVKVSVPKSASPAEYHRATGMETLFAALHLEGESDRVDKLLRAAYANVISDIKSRHGVSGDEVK